MPDHVVQDRILIEDRPEGPPVKLQGLNGLLIGSVADGAGSAPQAGAGARVAAERAVAGAASRIDALTDQPDDSWRDLIADVFGGVRIALEEAAAGAGRPVRDFDTTLLLFIATADRVVVGQDREGTFHACTWPHTGEYVNETVFLTSEAWWDGLQTTVRRGPISGVAAFSDGLERLCLNLQDGAPHLPFFSAVFRRLRATSGPDQPRALLEGLLRSDQVRSRTAIVEPIHHCAPGPAPAKAIPCPLGRIAFVI